MRFLRFLLIFYALGCWALHESDVGVVDWHKELIGVPSFASQSTAPRFASVDERNLILTATGNNVLAAIEEKDGSIAWRYIFDPEDRIVGFYQNGDAVVTLSGPGGATVRSIDVKTGQVILEHHLHSNSEGLLVEPQQLGKDVAFDQSSQEIYSISNGHTVTRLSATTGEPVWSWTSEDQTSLTIFDRLVSTPETVYVIGVSTSFASLTLHVATLSASTGQLIQSSEIHGSIHDPSTDLFAFTSAASPAVVWLEQGLVKYLPLTPELKKKKPNTLSGEQFTSIVDVGLSKHGVLVGLNKLGSTVLNIHGDGSNLKVARPLGGRDPTDSYAGYEVNGSPYLGRTYWSTKLEQVTLELGGTDALETTVHLPLSTEKHGKLAHFTVGVSPSGETTVFTTTSTGSIQLYKGSELQWVREEALATTVLVEFVELPERVAAEGDLKRDESFAHRIGRQIVLARDFPRYLVNFVKRFVTGSYASATSSAAAGSTHGPLSRDTFGFRQIIVSATTSGAIFGIDSGNGNVIWKRLLEATVDNGVTITPIKMWTMKTVSDGVDPEVVIVAQRRDDNAVDTVVYHINALNGDDLSREAPAAGVLQGVSVFQGLAAEAFLLEHHGKFVVLLDQSLKVHLYPNNQQTRTLFSTIYDKLSFPLRSSMSRHQDIKGYQIASSSPDNSVLATAYPTWALPLPQGEEIQTLLPPASRGPVASLGKVLGNRTTLYKYLNPRLFTALTVNPQRGLCGVYLVDSAKGTVVYHAEVPANHGTCDVKATLVENWLVYHYYESEFVERGNVKGTKGYRIVTVELYEGKGVDEKIQSSDMSAFVNGTTDLSAYEESFVFPHALSAIAPTTTKFGITAKDLIVATKNGKIQSFPRRLLNPRRPHRKPTSEEAEEGLFQYDPLVYDDPKRVISHNYQVSNVQKIVTAPALLESTSLVFAFGLDTFLTRVAPSNTFDVLSESFNKAQLVLTVSGLVAAILITRPMVQRKRLREKWYL